MAHGTHSSSGYHSQGSLRTTVWKLTEGCMGYFQWHPTWVRRAIYVHREHSPAVSGSRKEKQSEGRGQASNSSSTAQLGSFTLTTIYFKERTYRMILDKSIVSLYYQWSRRDRSCFLKPSTTTELILPTLDKLCPECGLQSRQCANNSFLGT